MLASGTVAVGAHWPAQPGQDPTAAGESRIRESSRCSGRVAMKDAASARPVLPAIVTQRSNV